ncbi:hypothetical protein DS2_03035 [Catenovulum agarivorans DS-2]|uniref:DUF4124 domain-containing protein n=1 Tax=Catenovulum agarivorans DS-2 TaxID=1328313 RepID=W7QFR8_9ALTE|nr:DUF4124 domain-containing protein [Catenovulum agarivorans]EWH11764.1 hypothetical protein DS2_03035 [Catenovulum agarivorans DS-2]
MVKSVGLYSRICITCLTLLFALEAVAAKVYVHRNAEGVLVFSDTPHPDAEEISPKSKIESIPSSTPQTYSGSSKQQAQSPQYQVRLVQPIDQATIRDNTGSVYVAVQVSPTYQAEHQVRVLLDGEAVIQPQNRSVFMLKNVFRGEHKLKVELLDANGKVIASSKPRTFYMHRASVIKPN